MDNQTGILGTTQVASDAPQPYTYQADPTFFDFNASIDWVSPLDEELKSSVTSMKLIGCRTILIILFGTQRRLETKQIPCQILLAILGV